jgi:2'-hydroxyisoflavone reductase
LSDPPRTTKRPDNQLGAETLPRYPTRQATPVVNVNTMRILVLGGTQFVGRAFVEASLARGHQVTLFNRGRTAPLLFPEAEHLRGDRDGDLSALRGRDFDAVLDSCGYVPRVVRKAAELLAPSVGQYVFISTVAVYANHQEPHQHETAPLVSLPEYMQEEITPKTYGGLKVLAERALLNIVPQSSLIIRPGLIVGPWDPSDRFTYWPLRVAAGGEVLAPVGPDYPVQFIDARDLALWMLTMIERYEVGIFNAVGPNVPLSLGELLKICREVTQSDATFTWLDEDFLLAKGVVPWMDLPLWIPGGRNRFDASKAVAHGLMCRPVRSTVADTLSWATRALRRRSLRAGLRLDVEIQLLREWNRRGPNDFDHPGQPIIPSPKGT